MSGSRDLDIVQMDRRIELDLADLGALADDLPVDLAVGRHVDDDVAQEHAPGRRAGGRRPSALALA